MKKIGYLLYRLIFIIASYMSFSFVLLRIFKGIVTNDLLSMPFLLAVIFVAPIFLTFLLAHYFFQYMKEHL